MNFRSKKHKTVEVTLTPMIDVVFLLLIFFMVTTSFNRETQINIALPEASGSEKSNADEVINLTIDANGIYYVNDHQVINQKPQTLSRALKQAANNAAKMPFIISADAKTPHQAVITALDVASNIGFKQIIFATKNTTDQ